MKVAVVSHNCCIRCTQSCLATKAAGHEVHLILHPQAASRQLNERMDSEHLFWDKRQLKQAIENVEPDLIHVHDRPHEIASSVIREGYGVPVVHDVHDMDSLLVMPMGFPLHEVVSLQKADGLVFVSDEYRDYAEQWLGPLPPNVVVPSMACRDLMPDTPMARIGAAVWEGGLYSHEPGDPRHYIDQRGLVRGFVSQGQAAFLYSAPNGFPDNAGPYTEAGGRVMSPLPYVPLLRHLTQFDWGWYGQTDDSQQIHTTLPNKMFDYLAAGLPVCVIHAEAAGRFVEHHNIGVHIQRPEEIVSVRQRLLDLRPHIWQRRFEFTRERAIVPMLELYERLTGKPGFPLQEQETHEDAVSQLRADDGGHGPESQPNHLGGVTRDGHQHGARRDTGVRNFDGTRVVECGLPAGAVQFAG